MKTDDLIRCWQVDFQYYQQTLFQAKKKSFYLLTMPTLQENNNGEMDKATWKRSYVSEAMWKWAAARKGKERELKYIV